MKKNFPVIIVDLIKSLYFREKTIISILLFLVVHLIEQLGAFGFHENLVTIANKIEAHYGLTFWPKLILDGAILFFGGDVVVIISEIVLIIVFIFLLKYQIKSRSLKDEDIKNIGITKENTDEILIQLKEIRSKTKIEAKDLEIVSSGFDMIVSNCKKYARNGKPNKALEILEQSKIFLNLLDDNSKIYIDFKVAQAKAFQEAEKIEEAILSNEEIIKKYKKDIRPYLYLADIYMQEGDFVSFEKYYNEAKAIDPQHPTIKNFRLLKQLQKREKITLDDSALWGEKDSSERAHCYYIHSLVAQSILDKSKRDIFLKKAIATDPNYLHYQTRELMNKISDLSEIKKNDGVVSSKALEKIEMSLARLENLTTDDDNVKRKLEIEYAKLQFYFIKHPNVELKKIKENIDNLITYIDQSHFDSFNDVVITEILDGAQPYLSDEIIKKIVGYISKFKKRPSDPLIFTLAMNAVAYCSDLSPIKAMSANYGHNKINKLIEAVASGQKDQIIKEMDNFPDNEKIKIIISIKDANLEIELIEKYINVIDDNWKNLLSKMRIGLLYDSERLNDALELIKKINLKNADPIISRLAFEISKKLGNFPNIERDALKRLLSVGAYPNEKHSFMANLAIAQYYLDEYQDALSNGKEVLMHKENISLTGQQHILFICLDILISEGKFDEAFDLINQNDNIRKDFRLHLKKSEILLYKKQYDDASLEVLSAMKGQDNLTDSHFSAAAHQLTLIENASGKLPNKPAIISENVFVQLDQIDEWLYVGKENPLNAVKIDDQNDKRYKILINKKINDEIDWVGDEGRIDKIKRKIKDIRYINDYIGVQGYKIMEKMAKTGSPYIKMFEVGLTIESIKEAMKKFMGKENEFFDLYKNNKLPLSFFISLTGGVGNALSKIRFNEGAHIHINQDQKDIEKQLETARKAVEGKRVHIDGTSLFILLESGIYKSALTHIPSFAVPASAMKEYQSIIQRFSSVAKNGSLQVGFRGDELNVTKMDEKQSDIIRKNITDFYQFINERAEIYGLADNERENDNIEKNILPAVSDACIKAQTEAESIVMTEDFLYLTFNSQLTGKRKPEYFSVWALLRVLVDLNKIRWDEYLETFYWLTIYKETFLPTNAKDIVKCLLSNKDGAIIFEPDNIDKLNLNYIWSENYSDIKSVLNVASDVLVASISDSSIPEQKLEEILPKIFIPVIKDKKDKETGSKLLLACLHKIRSKSIIQSLNIERRFGILRDMINRYEAGRKYFSLPKV